MSTDGKVPLFTPLNILGVKYLCDSYIDGSAHRSKVVEEVTDNLVIDDNGEPMNDCWRQYRVLLGGGSCEEISTYNQILAHLEKQYQDDINCEVYTSKFWTCKEILDHHKVERKVMVPVKWEDNSFTWEPFCLTEKDNPVTIADYSRKEMNINHLVEQAHFELYE
jgi:uncharacterized protein YktA (UPF0223 family)